MTSFTYMSDPGHGWLLVDRDAFCRTGLTEAYITPCSYASREGVLALEEDVDAPFFLNVWTHRFGDVEISESHAEQVAIRSWPGFGSRTEAGPHPDHVTALANEIAAERLALPRHEAAALMEKSNWGSLRGMIRREFLGTHRGYFPSCGMNCRSEAVIAECFDAIAILTGDTRRAKRWNTP